MRKTIFATGITLTLLFSGLVVGPGCKSSNDAPSSAADDPLVKRAEAFHAEACACHKLDCSSKLAKKGLALAKEAQKLPPHESAMKRFQAEMAAGLKCLRNANEK